MITTLKGLSKRNTMDLRRLNIIKLKVIGIWTDEMASVSMIIVDLGNTIQQIKTIKKSKIISVM